MHLLPLPVTLLVVAYPFSMAVGMVVALALKLWSYQ